jgi:hypothetical protein
MSDNDYNRNLATRAAGVEHDAALFAAEREFEKLRAGDPGSVRQVLELVEKLLGKRDGAVFLAAEREIADADQLAQAAATDEELQPIYRRHEAATDFIELTEPQSLAAVAVKLRRLLAPDAPLDGFDREIDSVGQCIAFLDREIAAPAQGGAGVDPGEGSIGFGEPEPR